MDLLLRIPLLNSWQQLWFLTASLLYTVVRVKWIPRDLSLFISDTKALDITQPRDSLMLQKL